jgi:hypothetical protein
MDHQVQKLFNFRLETECLFLSICAHGGLIYLRKLTFNVTDMGARPEISSAYR